MPKLLIIEDDDQCRRMLHSYFEKAGYMVSSAPDGKAGLDLFDTLQPDVMIIDIFMPEMDGFEVIDELAQRGDVSTVIAITGLHGPGYDAYLKMAHKMSVAYAFGKPLDMKDLSRAVQEIVDRRAAPQAELSAESSCADWAQAMGTPTGQQRNCSRAAPAYTDAQRVLLVDDEECVIEFEELLLTRLGYEVESFTRGNLALDRLRSECRPFGALVTDLTMPDISGLELARQARNLCAELPVILCSGHDAADLVAETKDCGIHAILTKPFDIQQLGQVLAEVFENCPKSADN